MDVKHFITDFREGFGEKAELPLAFWYSEEPAAEPFRCERCFIGSLKTARQGTSISMQANHLLCGGGKLYCGFVEPRPTLPDFVSDKERYKKSEALVSDYMKPFRGAEKAGQWINFARVDAIGSFDGKEGIIFFATPDILSGLVTWCLYDTNAPDAVSVPFGSGCSVLTAQVMYENKTGGKRTFLGMFDPSARPGVEENILTYSIPIGRFREMCVTLKDSCVGHGTKDWLKIKERINHGG